MSPWLRKQHLAMVYAKRGVGKTHFALGVAYAVAAGAKFLSWQAEKPRKVLYIDGEMPGPAMKERLAAVVSSCSEEPPEGYFRIITPDVQSLPLPDFADLGGQSDQPSHGIRVRGSAATLPDAVDRPHGERRELPRVLRRANGRQGRASAITLCGDPGLCSRPTVTSASRVPVVAERPR